MCNTIKCLVVITFCPCFLCLVPQDVAEMRVVMALNLICMHYTIYVAGCLTRDRIFAEFTSLSVTVHEVKVVHAQS